MELGGINYFVLVLCYFIRTYLHCTFTLDMCLFVSRNYSVQRERKKRDNLVVTLRSVCQGYDIENIPASNCFYTIFKCLDLAMAYKIDPKIIM